MSNRTIIEFDHERLGDLQSERERIFPALISGMRIPTSLVPFIRSGEEFAPGVRVLGQRTRSEPEWEQAAPLVARMRAALEAMYRESNGPRKGRLQEWAEAMRETSDVLDYCDERDEKSIGEQAHG